MSDQRVRLTPDTRKALIISAAIQVAEDKGLFSFSIANVSRAMRNTSKATIKHYFNMETLRTAVIEAAIDRNHLRLIAQAITADHKAVANLSPEERQRCLKNV